MIRFIKLFLKINLFIFLISCSFNNPTGFFDNRLIELEREISEKNSKLVFSKRKQFREEIDGNINKKLSVTINSNQWTRKNFYLSNNLPHFNYENKKQLVHKSKKIGKNKFELSDNFFDPLVIDEDIFFYDLTGNIFRYSIQQKTTIWKFNFYKKRFKKIPIYLKFEISENKIIISDNLGYIYSLNIDDGKLIWAKNFGIPFMSNLKVNNELIFSLNQDNKFYSINVNNGESLLSLETFPSFLKNNLETNISMDNLNNVYFLTSTGQLYSINTYNNNVNWLLNFNVGQSNSKLFYSSPIIYNNNRIFFSSSVSTFAIDTLNSKVLWELPFSTFIRPIISGEFMFLISQDGFMLGIDNQSGKVLWSKDLYKINKKINKKKFGNINSILLISNQLLITTHKGYLLFIDYKNGKILNYTRVTKSGFFSSPVMVDKKIHIIDNNFRVLVFN